jgi:ubiquitin C-terminal hydrolase
LTNNIKYPINNLDISKYICDESPYKNKAKYNLLGVNIHQEFGYSGTNSGHYTSLLKNRFDNNWYLFNDGNKPIQITKIDDLQNNNAYLLFYYRE